MAGKSAVLEAPKPNFGIAETAQQFNDIGEVREFTGDGTGFLYVPGLKELQYCRIGQTVLGKEKITVQMDNDATNWQKVEVPLAFLCEDNDGNPFLRRYAGSNDGIWQDGAIIKVGGVWAN